MKKYCLCLVLFLLGCTNIDKKAYYYNNAVKLNVVFNKTLKGFDKGYLRIALKSEEGELLDEKIVYDISHKSDSLNTKKILINFKNYDKSKNNRICLELFADTGNDDIYENYFGVLRENREQKEYVYDIR